MPRDRAPLQLPRPRDPGLPAGPVVRRSRGRRRLRRWRLRQAATGLALGALGIGILAGLVRIPDRLDALLLVSHALANLIAGLQRLALGVLQLAAVLAVVVLALLALLLLIGGAVRLWRALLAPVPAPRPRADGVAPMPPRPAAPPVSPPPLL